MRSGRFGTLRHGSTNSKPWSPMLSLVGGDKFGAERSGEAWSIPTVLAWQVPIVSFWSTVSIFPPHCQARRFIGETSPFGQCVYSFLLVTVIGSGKNICPKLFQWDSTLGPCCWYPVGKGNSTTICLGCYYRYICKLRPSGTYLVL